MRTILAATFLIWAVLAPALAAPSPNPTLGSSVIASMPEARSNAAVVEWGDRVYVFGGNGLQGPSAAAWELDPYTRSFQALPPMPAPRIGHAAAVCQNRILVFGGVRETTYEDGILAFDLQTRTWSQAGRMPFARARFGLAVLDGKVWIAGGRDADARSAAVHAYDPVAGTWTRKADLPEARDRLALVAMQGALYALGGETPDAKGSAACWRYSPADDRWARLPSLVQARRNLTAVRLGERILAVGGWNIIDDERVFASRIEVYDPQVRDWMEAGRLEVARDGCRAVVWRGRALVFGGFDGTALSSVEETSWRIGARRWSAAGPSPIALTSVEEGAPPSGGEATVPFAPATPQVSRLDEKEAVLRGLLRPAQEAAGRCVFLAGCAYPAHLLPELSVRRVLTPFLVAASGGWESVAARLRSPDAVTVVLARAAPAATTFDAAHPFPPLRLATQPLDGVAPQAWFDRTLRFAGLRVLGGSSAVAALEAETRALLARSYRPVNGTDAQAACFVDDSECDQAGDAPRFSVIRVERTSTGNVRLRCDDMRGTPPITGATAADLGGEAVHSTVLLVEGEALPAR